MHIGQPNAAGILGPGPVRRQINRFRCLEMLSNVHQTTSLWFAKLHGLGHQSVWTRHHRAAHRQSSPQKSMMHRKCSILRYICNMSGGDCNCHLDIVLLVRSCCSGNDDYRLYLECRLLDMPTGAPVFAAGEYVAGGNLY